MSEVKIIRLHICPQTHVRTTKDERWMLSETMTDEYLIAFGTKKYNERVEAKKKTLGSPNDYLNRKNSIKKYFDYKRSLKEEADKQGLKFPEAGAWIRFYLPMPKSWSKKKRNKNCYELHTSKPDADNIFKALADSLFKQDQGISDYRVSKFWYDGSGYIEIETGSLQPAIGYRKYEREDKIK